MDATSRVGSCHLHGGGCRREPSTSCGGTHATTDSSCHLQLADLSMSDAIELQMNETARHAMCSVRPDLPLRGGDAVGVHVLHRRGWPSEVNEVRAHARRSSVADVPFRDHAQSGRRPSVGAGPSSGPENDSRRNRKQRTRGPSAFAYASRLTVRAVRLRASDYASASDSGVAGALLPSFLIAWTSFRTFCAKVLSSCIARRTRVPAVRWSPWGTYLAPAV